MKAGITKSSSLESGIRVGDVVFFADYNEFLHFSFEKTKMFETKFLPFSSINHQSFIENLFKKYFKKNQNFHFHF